MALAPLNTAPSYAASEAAKAAYLADKKDAALRAAFIALRNDCYDELDYPAGCRLGCRA